ncbi:MAG: thymidine phosphorylase [bacterium]|nr:thymidine phosphorylase [bacterium]
MIPQWFIEEKRDGKSHSSKDIQTWVQGITNGDLPDYQISAWLMAVYLKGMTTEETAALTDAMMNSGEVLSFNLSQPTADKHSTGGIGDKISLPLAPLCAAMGLAIPMISGRGLGITGGTLDKLESIAGFNVNLDIPTFKAQVAKIGCSLIGQTATLAPADRRLYALRDVTATVPSIPLITASIMSKKLAEGAQTLLFDVKFGSGAFMRTFEDAQSLAKSLIATGHRLGRTCRALITDMDQPLGKAIGNAVEVEESLDILRGKGPQDVRELTLQQAAHMAHVSGLITTFEEALQLAIEKLDNGEALKKFEAICSAQNGDLSQPLPKAKYTQPYLSKTSGYIAHVNAEMMGRIALQLGAGRTSVTDMLDYGAGIDHLLQQGDSILPGQPLCILHACDETKIEAVLPLLEKAFTITPTPPPPRKLIHAII